MDDYDVHIINMSLGAPEPSIILQQAILNAFDNGILCICAAGNSAGPVTYPAAFDKTIAVAALGEHGFVPIDSFLHYPTGQELFGRPPYYAADFTNHGREINVIAPGVGIVSTVPSIGSHENPWVSMSGTSMASPVVSALLAILLADDKDYMAMGKERFRARYAADRLTASARSIDLPKHYEGVGLPARG